MHICSVGIYSNPSREENILQFFCIFSHGNWKHRVGGERRNVDILYSLRWLGFVGSLHSLSLKFNIMCGVTRVSEKGKWWETCLSLSSIPPHHQLDVLIHSLPASHPASQHRSSWVSEANQKRKRKWRWMQKAGWGVHSELSLFIIISKWIVGGINCINRISGIWLHILLLPWLLVRLEPPAAISVSESCAPSTYLLLHCLPLVCSLFRPSLPSNSNGAKSTAFYLPHNNTTSVSNSPHT